MKNRFTLIELLVVVAIVGILATMLMPALSKARLKAQQAVCVSNSKQSGYALTMFLDENDEFFPKNKVDGVSDESIWKGRDGTSLTIDHSKRALNPYLGTPDNNGDIKDALCPSEKGGFYEAKGNSYAAHVFGGKALKHTLQLSEVLQPRRVIAMSEVGGIRSESETGVSDAKYYWHTSYGKTNWVTVFVDGHAKPVTFTPGKRNAKLYTFRYDNVWND